MGRDFKKLYQGQPGTSIGDLYTVLANEKLEKVFIWTTNITDTDATLSLYDVPNAGSYGDTNAIIKGVVVKARSVSEFVYSQELTTGGKIRGLQGTASALTLKISALYKEV